MKFFSVLIDILLVILFTIITQVGGLLYLGAIFIAPRININFKFKRLSTFVVLYFFASFTIIPVLAHIGHRERIKHYSHIKPVNYLTVILNRNYVTPKMNGMLAKISNELSSKKVDIQLRYLDACFPFFNGFPLLPHLSHYDGKKIDFSLVYQNQKGEMVNESKSVSGYGVFEEPLNSEFNQTVYCKNKGYGQYDFSKYLTLGKINEELKFSLSGTKALLEILLRQKEVQKIFIEPHLANRMKMKHPKIRFQGCNAVRHDDHIHVQIY